MELYWLIAITVANLVVIGNLIREVYRLKKVVAAGATQTNLNFLAILLRIQSIESQSGQLEQGGGLSNTELPTKRSTTEELAIHQRLGG